LAADSGDGPGGLIGSALALAVGLLSTWGPRFGVPQLVQSRGASAIWVTSCQLVDALTAGIGWVPVNTISGTFALSTLTHCPSDRADFGSCCCRSSSLHRPQLHPPVREVTFPYLALVFTIATLVILIQSNPSVGSPRRRSPLAVRSRLHPVHVISFAYAAAGHRTRWTTLAIAPAVRKRSVFWSAMLGVFVPCAILESVARAWRPSSGRPGVQPTAHRPLVKPLPGILAGLTLLAIRPGRGQRQRAEHLQWRNVILALGVRVGSVAAARAAVLFGIRIWSARAVRSTPAMHTRTSCC